MIVDSIINKLNSAGFTVSFDDQDILLDTPSGEAVLSDELKAVVHDNKPEILFFLRMREYNQLRAQAEKLGAYLNSPAEPLPARKERLPEYERLIEQIGVLQGWVDHYQESGLDRWYRDGWVLIFSNLLNEMIVLIRSAEVKLPESARVYPAYFFEEVQLLDGKDDQTIRAAHSVKKTFNGQVAKGAKK